MKKSITRLSKMMMEMIQHMDTIGLGVEAVEKWEIALTMMDGVWIATEFK